MVRRVLVWLVLVVCAGCREPAAEPAVSSVDEDIPQTSESFVVKDPPRTIEELRARVAAILEHDHVAGAAFALVDRNGPIYVGGVGVRDRATREPVDADTVFRVGSLSKSLIALGV